MNVLKESVVVHRSALTQMGAITVLAMMVTSFKMMITTATVTSVLHVDVYSEQSLACVGESFLIL